MRKLETLRSFATSEISEDSATSQWELFKKYHAKGSWKGIWTTYDAMGDVVGEAVASVNLDLSPDGQSIQQTHTMVVGAKVSDCETCFDSFDTKTVPVASYTPGQLHRSRFSSAAMINGPTVLRSGMMATELVLSHGDGRVRVVFQHVPAWENGVEPGSCPPQVLKIYRCVVSREALRDSPPTRESEAANPPPPGNPTFFRPIPPFAWNYNLWGGQSWTWGQSQGAQEWDVPEMEEHDAWHGRHMGDSDNVWVLKIGGLLIHGPKLISGGGFGGLYRVAWLPEEDTLLRTEASIVALEPMTMDDENVVGFHPPSLVSFRSDAMKKTSDLPQTAL
ncbi:unnamed protein product [Heterosigma akashiwo]